jgi:uncharacterized protein (TIGR00288 family)
MEEERICLFLDFENLAIGAREQLGGKFDFAPIADALAERGRVVVRRAYADWSMFDDARRELTRHHVELIEIPQKMGMVRKNAADIKLAVDAIELSFERSYITTFVIGTGDSDFTPLVHKLRELNKRVIGIGIEASTAAILPPACDEFLFYERLPGVESSRRKGGARRGGSGPRRGERSVPADTNGDRAPVRKTDLGTLDGLVTQTLAGLKRRSGDVVLGSMLKRTLLRKDPTFDEGVYGFRSLGDMLRNLAERKVIQLTQGSAPGDPQVDFPEATAGAQATFELLRKIAGDLGGPHLTGLKDEVRKHKRGFSEKRFGYADFEQFARAAEANGHVQLQWDEAADDYVVKPADASAPTTEEAAAAETTAEPAAASAKKKPARRRTRAAPKAEIDAGDRVISRTTVRRKPKPPAEGA